MASNINFYIVAALVFVLIGSVPCTSNECTGKNIDECHTDNLKMPEECLAHKKYIKCLEAILPDCTDDKVIGNIHGAISYSKRAAEACPGFPDGTCYENVLYDGCGEAPYYNVKYAKDEAAKKKTCDDFKGKVSQSKTCAQDVKDKCVETIVFRAIEEYLEDVDKVLGMCADFYNTTSV